MTKHKQKNASQFFSLSQLKVSIGLRSGSASADEARARGFNEKDGTLGEVFDVLAESDFAILLISDAAQVRRLGKRKRKRRGEERRREEEEEREEENLLSRPSNAGFFFLLLFSRFRPSISAPACPVRFVSPSRFSFSLLPK